MVESSWAEAASAAFLVNYDDPWFFVPISAMLAAGFGAAIKTTMDRPVTIKAVFLLRSCKGWSLLPEAASRGPC